MWSVKKQSLVPPRRFIQKTEKKESKILPRTHSLAEYYGVALVRKPHSDPQHYVTKSLVTVILNFCGCFIFRRACLFTPAVKKNAKMRRVKKIEEKKTTEYKLSKMNLHVVCVCVFHAGYEHSFIAETGRVSWRNKRKR